MKTFQELWDSHDGLYSAKHVTYPGLYNRFLSRFVGTDCTLIEFGVLRGGSMQIWRKFLGERARIIGVDCEFSEDWSRLNGDAETIIGYQEDPQLLAKLPDPDIVIDDADHQSGPQITSFNTLWPRVKNGGLYVVEDLMPRNAPIIDAVMNACYLKFPVHIHREILFAEKVEEPVGEISTGTAT
jgi:hypothetical protein